MSARAIGAVKSEKVSEFVTKHFYPNGSWELDCPAIGGMMFVSAPNTEGKVWTKDTSRDCGPCQQHKTGPGTCITRKKQRWILSFKLGVGYYWERLLHW